MPPITKATSPASSTDGEGRVIGEIDKAYARIAEGQLHLRRAEGAGDALPLIMLHASPASGHVLEPLMTALGDHRTHIAFDNPCNGQSCVPLLEEPEVAHFADMLDRACDALGLTDITLYGTHSGAHFAIAWALARPDRVKALVLDGVAMLDAETVAEFLKRYALPQRPDPSGAQFHWAWQFIRDQMIFFPHYCKDADHLRAGGNFDPDLLHRLTLDVLANLESYHLPYRAVFRHDVRADLTRLNLPVLVMSEGEGPLDPAFGEVCQMVRGANTATQCATPMAKAAAIAAFLEELA